MKSIKNLMWLSVAVWGLACVLGAFWGSKAYNEWLRDNVKFQWGDAAKGVVRPEIIFVLAVGIVAIMTFYTLLDRSDSLRVPIAATLTIVFFAFLLFPNIFSGQTPKEFRDEFIKAFTIIMGFYFTAEAAVQTTKVVQERKERTDPPAGGTPPSSTPPAAVPGDTGALTLDDEKKTSAEWQAEAEAAAAAAAAAETHPPGQ